MGLFMHLWGILASTALMLHSSPMCILVSFEFTPIIGPHTTDPTYVCVFFTMNKIVPIEVSLDFEFILQAKHSNSHLNDNACNK